MLRADLHVHTNYSHDSGASLQSIIDQCLKTGINCLAVTDHNTIKGALELQRMSPFKIIVGEEVKSSEGDIIGLFLKEGIPKNLTPRETVKAIKSQGGLVMIPHPFDRVRPSALGWETFESLASDVNVIETFNARNLFNLDDAKAVEAAQEVQPATCRRQRLPHRYGAWAHLQPNAGLWQLAPVVYGFPFPRHSGNQAHQDNPPLAPAYAKVRKFITRG